jgi:hypothetical protein
MNNISSDSPMTTSGITSGAIMEPKNNDRPRNTLNLVMTMAAIVPNIMDTVADTQAIFRLVTVARRIMGLEMSILYHFKENPVQVLTNLDSLNE